MVEDRINEIAEKGGLTFESVHGRKDGSLMNVEIHSRAIEHNGTKHILSVAHDITEHRQAEATLQREQLLLKRTVETSPVGIVVLNQGR